jgi:hypothetical protein
MKRRRIPQTLSLEERLTQAAKQLREKAKLLPSGTLRETLLRKARQAEEGAYMNEWLRSSDLRHGPRRP